MLAIEARFLLTLGETGGALVLTLSETGLTLTGRARNEDGGLKLGETSADYVLAAPTGAGGD